MHLELHCPRCSGSLRVESPSARHDHVFSRTAGPWDTLGDGETLEDRLFAELDEREHLVCPDCGLNCPVNEEQVGRWAMNMLACW